MLVGSLRRACNKPWMCSWQGCNVINHRTAIVHDMHVSRLQHAYVTLMPSCDSLKSRVRHAYNVCAARLRCAGSKFVASQLPIKNGVILMLSWRCQGKSLCRFSVGMPMVDTNSKISDRSQF